MRLAKRPPLRSPFIPLQGDRADDEVEFSFAFFNAANEPITEVRQGDSFKVAVYVDDLRPEKGRLGDSSTQHN